MTDIRQTPAARAAMDAADARLIACVLVSGEARNPRAEIIDEESGMWAIPAGCIPGHARWALAEGGYAEWDDEFGCRWAAEAE